MPQESPTAVYAALIGNIAVAVSKFAVTLITGSSAMFAEGIHSLVDSGNEILLLYGLHRSRRPPDADHPFGHGRELYFWSLIVAFLIFGVGGGISVYEGILHIMNPPTLESPKWNYIVLGLAALLDGTSFIVGYRQLRKDSGGQRLWRVIRTSKDPSTFTVVLEDLADLAGLLIAFLGIYFAQKFKNPHLDGVASVLIGLILALTAMVIMRETKGLLLGESADDDMLKAVCSIAEQDQSVDRVSKPLSVYLGPHSVILAIAIQFRRDLPAVDVAAAVQHIEGAIRRAYPDVKQVFIEAKALSNLR